MRCHRFPLAYLAALLLASYCGLSAQQLLTGPRHDSGQSVTGAFEGWFQNQDGSFSLLFGYYNRNLKQELDIPVGADNRMEPGGPDRGQPTHFLPRRQWGIFTVTVPKDFGSSQLTWTLTANAVTTMVPGTLNPLCELAPFRDANGNTPPFIGFSAEGPFVQGPHGHSTSLATVLPNPVNLTLWVADDASVVPGATAPKTPAVSISWSKFRGPGSVTFAQREADGRDRGFQGASEHQISAAKQPLQPRLASRENTCCARRPTIGPATAAADFSVAGRTRKSKSLSNRLGSAEKEDT